MSPRAQFNHMPDCRHYFLPKNDVGIHSALFDPTHLSLQNAIRKRLSTGRGEVVFFQHDSCSLVLRHYQRGGLAARVSSDRYLWLGAEMSRPWREYRLLTWMQSRGLPVPRPYAAHIERRGIFYSADIITHNIDGTVSLAQKLKTGKLPPDVLSNIGATIRRFHDEDVDHVDLNANNILVTESGAAWLIDFDRCRVRAVGKDDWKRENMLRLQRSLKKLQARDGIHFNESAWRSLLDGYDHPR